MFKQKQVVIDNYTTIYVVMKNPKPGSSFQLKINDHFSCTPKTEKVKNYLCGSVPYHALKGGTLEATLNIMENGIIKSNKKLKFKVFFPTYKVQWCLKDLEIHVVSPDLNSSKLFNASDQISFNISGLDCHSLRITDYEWKLYKYIHFELVTNCPDESDFKEITGLPSAQDNLVLPKNSLKYGYYYLCVRVHGIENAVKLACVSIII